MMKNIKISTSDWRILRTLWEHGPLKPKDITKYLEASKDWNVSTVKTLLSRLLKKGLVSVDTNPRYPQYSTVYTEEDCVEFSISETITSIYGDSYVGESNFFTYYGYASDAFFNIVSQALEEQYHTISAFFSKRRFGDRKIMMHKTMNSFCSATGVPLSSSFMRVAIHFNMIHVSPESRFKGIKVEDDISYWLTYALLNEVSMELPFYFKQGISYYLSKIDFTEQILLHAKDIINELSLNTLWDLMIEKDTYDGLRMGYVSYLLIDFIIGFYGSDILKGIVYEEIRLSKLITKDTVEFIENWKKHIMQKYVQEELL